MDTSLLKRLDLNLVLALHFLLSEEGVSHAAVRYGVSQPSMSAALRRLREHFGDRLLVRQGGSMKLTEFAGRLRPLVAEAVRALREVLDCPAEFDPARSTGLFRLAISEDESAIFLPMLVAVLAREAPDVRVEVERFDAFSAQRLHGGDVDLWILKEDRVANDAPFETLSSDRWVFVGCAEAHRRTAVRSLAKYAGFPRVSVLEPPNAFPSPYPVEDPGGALLVPSRSQALRCLAGTPRIAAVPRRLFEATGPHPRLRVLSGPRGPAGSFNYAMQWPAAADQSSSSLWLRGVVRGVGAALGRG